MVSLMAPLLATCGGSDNAPAGTSLPPPAELTTLSAPSPFADDCSPHRGTLYRNAEVEPFAAINPANPANRIAVWQQDRWDSGGAQGLMAAASLDGGQTWTLQPLQTARCPGGADFERATDPWVTFGPDGIAYALSLSFTGTARGAGSSSAMLVLRSVDGGIHWSDPQTLISDGADVFNDKGAITADPLHAGFAYVVWDRVLTDFQSTSQFTRTTDGGATWEPARAIFDPGERSQTIGNQVVVLPDGALLNVFEQIDTADDNSLSATVKAMRSTDRGEHWTAPVTIADELTVGTRDPQTGRFVRDGGGLPTVAVSPTGDALVAWQDARFSGGARDGIALSRSGDGGMTWDEPVQVNGEPAAAAFTPAIQVLADGRIGVAYYDLRPDTADADSLLAAFWLTTSSDGENWREALVAGPFDLDRAPNSNGAFVGDYEALLAAGDAFETIFAITNATSANPTDIFSATLGPSAFAAATMIPARSAAAKQASAGFRSRVDQNLRRLVGDERPPAAR